MCRFTASNSGPRLFGHAELLSSASTSSASACRSNAQFLIICRHCSSHFGGAIGASPTLAARQRFICNTVFRPNAWRTTAETLRTPAPRIVSRRSGHGAGSERLSDIFISYARSNADVAHAIAEALRALGHGVVARRRASGAPAYADVIEERLNAAKAVVVIWSAEAVKSEWGAPKRPRPDGPQARPAHRRQHPGP